MSTPGAPGHEQDVREPARRPSRRSWLQRHLWQLIVGVVVPVAVLVITIRHDSPQPAGTIDAPHRGQVVPKDRAIAGGLTHIPNDEHVWLAARVGQEMWPAQQELPHDPHWEITIPRDAPHGRSLALILFSVGDEGQERIHRAAVRGQHLPEARIPDLRTLDVVPSFFVKQEVVGHPLWAVFPQARTYRRKGFHYANGGGVLTATFPDTCHRPERAAGLRLRWNLSGAQDGGWGVEWKSSPPGRYDASRFTSISLSVKGAEGGETFGLGLKDTTGTERKVKAEDLPVVSTEWQTLEVPLGDFSGVRLKSLDNVSISFDSLDGAGELCIDEMAFRRIAG